MTDTLRSDIIQEVYNNPWPPGADLADVLADEIIRLRTRLALCEKISTEQVGAACIAAIQRYAGTKRPDYHASIEAGIAVFQQLYRAAITTETQEPT